MRASPSPERNYGLPGPSGAALVVLVVFDPNVFVSAGHAFRTSLEIYSRLALADAQQTYEEVIGRFPV